MVLLGAFASYPLDLSSRAFAWDCTRQHLLNSASFSWWFSMRTIARWDCRLHMSPKTFRWSTFTWNISFSFKTLAWDVANEYFHEKCKWEVWNCWRRFPKNVFVNWRTDFRNLRPIDRKMQLIVCEANSLKQIRMKIYTLLHVLSFWWRPMLFCYSSELCSHTSAKCFAFGP